MEIESIDLTPESFVLPTVEHEIPCIICGGISRVITTHCFGLEGTYLEVCDKCKEAIMRMRKLIEEE